MQCLSAIKADRLKQKNVFFQSLEARLMKMHLKINYFYFSIINAIEKSAMEKIDNINYEHSFAEQK